MEFTLVRLISLFLLFHLTLNSAHESNQSRHCHSFNCGTNGKLSFPFSNLTNPECGFFVVNCTESKIKVRFQDGGEWYNASGIDHDQLLIGLYDEKLNSCDALNHFSIPSSQYLSLNMTSRVTSLIKCKRNNSHQESFRSLDNYTGCKDYDVYYHTNPNKTLPSLSKTDRFSCSNITLPPNDLATWLPKSKFPWGPWFLLQWKVPPLYDKCHKEGGFFRSINGTIQCKGTRSRNMRNKAAVVAGVALIVTCCAIAICCCLRRSNTPMNICTTKTNNSKNVEAFLKDHGLLAPTRYKYKDVKKITNSFTDKIGQGGFGSVFKGKLHNGNMVAVKILSETKGDGNEFINEVASISRTSHVNIVALLGSCVKGAKRALVYEFMPNGSLEKFIYSEIPLEMHCHLGWGRLYKVAIGIARGLEYLHRGCSTRILHFDIKPHSILLDQNFNPKIADFGLSKLCHATESIVSMTRARGTAGYIAPEVVSTNFGVVSHKSDVYSYGMMLLEMVGGRKNIDVRATNISEIYFPHWIHKRLNLNEDLGLHGVTSLEDQEIARKMILVGLWCIQIDPKDRPPMSTVLDMLQGSLEAVEVPPSPFLSSLSGEDEGPPSSI